MQRVVERFNGSFDTKNKPKSNLYRKLLTKRTERKLSLTSKRNPKLTARHCESVIENNSVNSTKKPTLTTMHKKSFDWFKRKSAWALMTGIFSDECRIELHPQTHEYVRRRVGTNTFNGKYINQTRKFSASVAIRSDG